MKNTLLSIILGMILGSLIMGITLAPTQTSLILDNIQAVTFIIATIFTAWWTSKTFGLSGKTTEAKQVIKILNKLEQVIPDMSIDRTPLSGDDPTSDAFYEFLVKKSKEAIVEFWRLIDQLKFEVNNSITIGIEIRKKVDTFYLYKNADLSVLKRDRGKDLLVQISAIKSDFMKHGIFDFERELVIMKRRIGL